MGDFEEVDIGGPVHIHIRFGTGTSSAFGGFTASSWSGTFRPPRPAPPPPLPQPWDPAKAQKLYRALAKKLHPDLNSGLIHGHTPEAWMKDLNRIMAARRMDKLVKMASLFCQDMVSG
jgi:hypothetical protein